LHDALPICKAILEQFLAHQYAVGRKLSLGSVLQAILVGNGAEELAVRAMETPSAFQFRAHPVAFALERPVLMEGPPGSLRLAIHHITFAADLAIGVKVLPEPIAVLGMGTTPHYTHQYQKYFF